MDHDTQGRVRTMCPMNCHPTLCGMQVEVADGQLVGISGDDDNPDSAGFLCVRGIAAHEIIGNPKRILYPMVRRLRGSDDWQRGKLGRSAGPHCDRYLLSCTEN